MLRDCILLVADSDIKATVEGLFSRPSAIPIRPISFDIIVHPQRDPGVRLRSRGLLEPFRYSHSRAISILDHEGCGSIEPVERVEANIESSCASHWHDRIRAIAIAPEIENWVWSDSPRVDEALGWAGKLPNLRQWLVDTGSLSAIQEKPSRPKEAFDAALRYVNKPRSATIFAKLGATVSLNRCNDRAFGRFRKTLQGWFPITSQGNIPGKY